MNDDYFDAGYNELLELIARLVPVDPKPANTNVSNDVVSALPMPKQFEYLRPTI